MNCWCPTIGPHTVGTVPTNVHTAHTLYFSWKIHHQITHFQGFLITELRKCMCSTALCVYNLKQGDFPVENVYSTQVWSSGRDVHKFTLIISMLEKLVTSDQLSIDFLTVAKLTNQTSHVSQY